MNLTEGQLFTIEALNRIDGFVWPEGAKFAAIDCNTECVEFYSASPKIFNGRFSVSRFRMGEQAKINGNSPNWRGSLINKKQFDNVDGWVRVDKDSLPVINAEAAIDIKHFPDGDGFQSGSLAKFIKWDGVKLWRYHKPTKETEMKDTEDFQPPIHETYYRYKKQRETTADARKALEASMEAEDKLLEQIKAWNLEHGFDVRLLDESEEKPELVITDWRDLRIGDIVEVIMVNKRGGTDGYDDIIGEQCRVMLIEDPGVEQQAVKVEFDGYGVFIHEWKFIRRPSK